MEISSLPKFCPVCKLANEKNSLVCEFCGAVFVDLHLEEYDTTKNVTQRRSADLTSSPTELKPPAQGVAFFLFGKSEPYAVHNEDIMYLGRLEKETTEVFVDLTLADGFTQGVSRRHAMIQRRGDRVEIMDLHSSNGTYLNGTRLEPSKLYELKSGTVVQLGRLKLIPIFSWVANH